MSKQKTMREIVKFVSNEPVSLVLDTEPTEAKSNTRETQWGSKTSYTYFTGDNRVMFPSQALHDKLSNYSRGDTVTINLVDGKMWSVTSDSPGKKSSPKVEQLGAQEESLENTLLLRKISNDIDTIKSHLFGNSRLETKNEVKETNKEEDENLDF